MRFVVAIAGVVSLSLIACGPARRGKTAHAAQETEEEEEDDFISAKQKKKKRKGESGDASDIVGWKRIVGEDDARAFVPLFGKAARIHGCQVQENGAAVVADCSGHDIRMVRDGGKILIGCKGWGTLEECQQLFNEIIDSAKKSVPHSPQGSPPGGSPPSGPPPASGNQGLAPSAPSESQVAAASAARSAP